MNLLFRKNPQRFLFIALLILGLLPTSALAAPLKLTLMLDWFINPNHGPIIVAKEQGWFKQAGLDLTILQPSDPNLPSRLVATNQINMAVSYPSTLLTSVTHGLPLMQSGTLIGSPLNSLIVLNSNHIDRISQLKGKTIGVAVSSSGNAALKTILNSGGVKLDQVTLVNVGWSLTSALAMHRVDAIWSGLRNYEYVQLQQMGVKVHAFYPEEHQVPPYSAMIFVVNKNHLNLPAIHIFNQVIAKASQYILNHPQQAWLDFMAYSPKTLNTPLNKASWFDTVGRFSQHPAAMDPTRYQTYAQFLHRTGIISYVPKPSSYLLFGKSA